MSGRVFWITSKGVMSEEQMRQEDDEISVMLPYWAYNRICPALRAMNCPTKPEDYVVAVLEGHVRGLDP